MNDTAIDLETWKRDGGRRPEKRPDGWPTRADLEWFSPAELAIRDAMLVVESTPGGSPALTDAVTFLAMARDRVADHVEGRQVTISFADRDALISHIDTLTSLERELRKGLELAERDCRNLERDREADRAKIVARLRRDAKECGPAGYTVLMQAANEIARDAADAEPVAAPASEDDADRRDWRTALNLAGAYAEDWLPARNDIKAALAAARAEAESERDELRTVLSESRDAVVGYQARVAKIEAQHLAYADITQKRIGELEGAEGLRGLLASASNLVGVVRNKQWERVASKADSLDFAINRARALLGDSTPEPARDRSPV